MSIGNPMPYNPTYGVGVLLMYGLLGATFINNILFSFITKPHYERQISTTEELIHYEYKILIDLEFVELNDLGNDEVITVIATREY